MRQSILGSREAFGLLVVRYSRSVRAVCLARTGRSDDLDDLVQEAFLRAFRGLSRLEDPKRFGAFLHRIANNICVDRVRRAGREPVATAEVDFASPVAAEQVADIREERLERMRRQVGRLPLALREAVLMFYFEQKPMADIATMLGITEGAVNQRLHRARQQLKQSLGASSDAASSGADRSEADGSGADREARE
ncbi:MAG: RNA polymerase sigma factor [bacterium]|nr:RNA polymerase sigma factor [bacterium]